MTNKTDHPFKQTNMPLAMRLYFTSIQLTFKVLGKVSPRLAGKLALKIFMKPPNVQPPRREGKIREQAKLSFRSINDRKIAVRVWENNSLDENAPTVLLSHGWAGRTSQFLEFIEPLVDAGYRVVGADIPAHGESSGSYTNILDSTLVLSHIAKEFGPIDTIIGHSFGTGTTLLALDKFDIETKKVVLIGAYSRITFIIELFSELFDLNQATQDAMLQIGTEKFADSYGIKWNWENIAPVETIKSYRGKLLFIHDETDHEVPIEEVQELHDSVPDAEILITTGFGHRRILRNKEVISTTLDFIQDTH